MTLDDFKIGEKVFVNTLGARVSCFKEGEEVLISGYLGSVHLETRGKGGVTQYLSLNQIYKMEPEPRKVEWV